ncbi:pentapeptide repeat-containing protein [Propionicimonas sp.]|uniref:pentapeptide repeat-containing protein n=1 Tax=Propionicimonas sp. TaxID=1955623 RepID=UPI001857117A|nr:pentapeptide repeat-containing protein [Propionicimonas sp.]MBU3975726.1 pentapeptide repeat-containing protein [Actinomycetota bacterium]MBA3019871.1 pentapeptide repeat-containing protein [Propionicimonas sp.]MBU3986125.1 pentapeptide repeat-containing protein [Actinomycetota bacterium]MBU4007442.1 pentapeptide repeat-containing protein [Actinomycetota bacterium]MBU4063952.1 pentapeptide repeat-containing protein [Actinomycetota bacterium]
MASRPTSTVAPKLGAVTLGEVRVISADEFTATDGDDLEAIEFSGASFAEVHWDGRRRLDSSRLHEVRINRWRARASTFSDSQLSQLDVVALSAPESGWRDVALIDSRIGSAELHQANLRRVAVTGCKLGYVNLRDADLADLVFTDCVIEDLDLLRAKAKRVSLAGCRIRRLELGHSRLEDFDLRGATFEDVSGLEGLRGVTISTDQLFDLAPILAGRLGLKVE